MENEYLHDFNVLKRQLVETCRKAFPFLPEDLQVWKGTEIACFQEVLEEKTKGRISEKSFYNYFKGGDSLKLPREDVLDMFAQMVGEINWKDFVRKNRMKEGIATEAIIEADTSSTTQTEKGFRYSSKMVAMMIGGLLLSGGIFYATQQHSSINDADTKVRICFEDIYTHRPIVSSVEVHLLKKNTKQIVRSDSLGCVTWEKGEEMLSFYIKSPYYKLDTLHIKGNESQTVMLKPDDYAMMIRLYASSKIEDWEAHLGRLQSMFSEEAEIFQIEEETGYIMEVWNKEEFIEKLTTPIPSLQRLEVLETEYNQKQQIKVLRFLQK